MVPALFCLFNIARFAQFTTNGFHPQWGALEKKNTSGTHFWQSDYSV